MKIIRVSELQYIPASHEDPKKPGVLKKVLARSEELIAGKVMMINWALLPAGKSFESHYHEDLQEIFIILSGKTRIQGGETLEELHKGDAVIIDSGEIHTMTNVSEVDVEYVALGISKSGTGKTVNI